MGPASCWDCLQVRMTDMAASVVAPIKPDTQRVERECTRAVIGTPTGNAGAWCCSPHPAIDQGESGSSIGDWVHPDVIALERLHQRLGHAVLSGLSTGVKPGTRLSAKAVSIVLWATKIDPLSESHCTGCGARISPKRFSTQSSIMSRIISPEIPAVVATQLIT